MKNLDEFLGIKVKGYHIRPRVGGLCTRDPETGDITSNITDWHPSENVAQAIECLDFLTLRYRIDKGYECVVSIYAGTGLVAQSDDARLAVAACQAMGRWVGFEGTQDE